MALCFNLTRNSKDFLIPVSLKNLHVSKRKERKQEKTSETYQTPLKIS